jgi:hypothetical protein
MTRLDKKRVEIILVFRFATAIAIAYPVKIRGSNFHQALSKDFKSPKRDRPDYENDRDVVVNSSPLPLREKVA